MILIRAVAIFGLMGALTVSAQEYPSRPVRVIVPWSPGGGADVVARIVAAKMSESLGQQFIVENRSGASGIIGTDVVAKAAPDGYTLVIGSNSTYVIAVALGTTLPYDPARDLTPIARLGSVPHVLTVHPSVSATTVSELISFARARPGQLAFSSAGNGTTPHLAGEIFKLATGINLLHVPYKGSGQSVQDLLGGSIQVSFDTLPTVLAHIRSGRLRTIAALGPKRVSALPEVPTISEAGIRGAEGLTWYGFYGPGRLPRSLTQKLHAEAAKIMKLSDVKSRLDVLGVEDGTHESPQEFAGSVKDEIVKYAKVASAAGIKSE